ncbi:nitronate monooxygenase family protein [Sneathiella marina]|uniref:Nitronate monooxygenase family protein n=1 Tax=Sneathiella marina TaxID=2950108 RepID=A0ABY4W005_9PROT|nr:nitronate monooxygenase family protein [Sneathiella marina]USG60465.1 nitronate monooxygenase family protein [Sneathiella marina]
MTMPSVLEGRLSLPVIASPMFIVSGPELVIAQCKEGIVGSFPALNARPIEQLDEWLYQIKAELAEYAEANPDKKVAPFAVNQIVHASNSRLMEDVALCVKHEVPIIITSLRAPNEIVEAIHSYGGIILHDVTNIRHAEKAIEAGVDGLILVCAGAGGHAGKLSPFALVSEIRQFFDGPIALSGAIANGHSILSAQALGADLAYMGSAFIATQEANAVDGYKEMIVESRGEDIVYTNTFTGVHGNYLSPSITRAGLDPENLPGADKSRMNFGSGGISKAKAWKDIWGSGQGIGSVNDIPTVADYVDRLKEQYAEAKVEMNNKAL